jgi:hypothetical protein
MAQTAARLVDHVIPPVPVRQSVISVPKRQRWFLSERAEAIAALAVLREAEKRSHDTSRIVWAPQRPAGGAAKGSGLQPIDHSSPVKRLRKCC